MKSRTTKLAGGRSHTALIAALLTAAVSLILLFVSSAFAARGHVFDPDLTIGTPCTELVCAPGELKEPSAVAVNEATGASTQSISSAPGRPHSSHPEALRSTSRVRGCSVLDQGNDRVQRFGSSGAPA